MSRPDSPQDRIQQILSDDPLADLETVEADASEPAESPVTAALAAAGHDMLSGEASELLLDLTADAVSIEPEARARLVEAAQRALSKRRDDASPLPRLLFLARREAGEAVESVARAIAVDRDDLLHVERGVKSLEQFGADSTAAWVMHFGVPLDQARAAIRRTLQLQAVDERAAASRVDAVEVDNAPFLTKVTALLEDAYRR
ncbi:hypothetical protein [uncultured Jatrophihabitans sp.]|uniref:hypothetical protein n=1 Tax=uncultured Jatrophihabitans sp. TaxID=1610747 RepID=UPI0035C9F530